MSAPVHGDRGLGIYVHVPFCRRVCPYCDFAVQAAHGHDPNAIVAQIGSELQHLPEFAHALTGQPVATLYLGGGTPSLLSAAALGDLLAALAAHCDLSTLTEFTLEANPEDVDAETLTAWRDLGVTRLSLGVQSFDDAELRFLGRAHDGQQARRAARASLDAGFQAVSVDLIFGLPEQTSVAWQANLDALAALRPDHVSCYQLTYHEGTPLHDRLRRGRITACPEDRQGELYEQAHRALLAAGLSAYEVSNFARSPAARSSHNQGYWNHQPYLGLGPSAHSFDGTSRWWNERALADYANRVDAGSSAVVEREILTAQELLHETILLRTRTGLGLDLDAVAEHFEMKWPARAEHVVADWAARDLARMDGRTVITLPSGMAVADSLAMALIDAL